MLERGLWPAVACCSGLKAALRQDRFMGREKRPQRGVRIRRPP